MSILAKNVYLIGPCNYGTLEPDSDDRFIRAAQRLNGISESVLNHFAIEYNDNTLVIWVNGVSRKTHDLNLPALYDIELNEKYYGIVSLYNRELTKLEIIEHYVKYHVKAFTHNEVLS